MRRPKRARLFAGILEGLTRGLRPAKRREEHAPAPVMRPADHRDQPGGPGSLIDQARLARTPAAHRVADATLRDRIVAHARPVKRARHAPEFCGQLDGLHRQRPVSRVEGKHKIDLCLRQVVIKMAIVVEFNAHAAKDAAHPLDLTTIAFYFCASDLRSPARLLRMGRTRESLLKEMRGIMRASKRANTQAKRAMIGKQFAHVSRLLGHDGMLEFAVIQMRQQARKDARRIKRELHRSGQLGPSWWIHAARAKANASS